MTHKVYEQGDWVVHSVYGIGQITAIETKDISGEPTRYYRVKTDQSILWIPMDAVEGPKVRPPANEERLLEALTCFEEPAEPLPTRYDQRRQQLRKMRAKSGVSNLVRLLRDLYAHKQEHSLRLSERRFLEQLQARLILEWTLAGDLSALEAEQRLQQRLATIPSRVS
jgi:RNA polymerase-interacting CarD/CdnL/TRCF family regulator